MNGNFPDEVIESMHEHSNPPVTWSFQNGGRAPLRRCLDLPLLMEFFNSEASLRVLDFFEMISAVLQLTRVGYIQDINLMQALNNKLNTF